MHLYGSRFVLLTTLLMHCIGTCYCDLHSCALSVVTLDVTTVAIDTKFFVSQSIQLVYGSLAASMLLSSQVHTSNISL